MSTVSMPARMHRSGWTITEGVLLVVVGIIAMVAPMATAAFTAWALPFVLFAEGIVLIVTAFRGRTVGSRVWSIVLGIIGLLAGFAVLARPLFALASLPVILGVYLVVKGITLFAAGSMATEGKGWIYTAGALSIALAILVWIQPFGASLFLTGLYIGISILMLGIALLMLPSAEETMGGPVVTE